MPGRRITDGMAHWPALAAQAGLPPDGWRPRLLSTRQDGKGDRVVILLGHPRLDPVVLKQSFRPGDAAAIARNAAAQDRAAVALAGHPAARVPRILAVLPDDAAVLMQAAPGLTLLDQARLDPGALPAALRRAGEWLDAFHRAGPVERRAFQPRFMADHFAAMAAEIRAGTRKVARRAAFLGHVAAFLPRAATARDAPTLSSWHHGDLTARNLILGPGQVWGIDMAGGQTRPVAYDIARLLVYLAGQIDVAPTPAIVPPALRAAFHAGYRLIPADDPVLDVLIAARLLSDWLSMPDSRARMTLTELARFTRISRLAAAALA